MARVGDMTVRLTVKDEVSPVLRRAVWQLATRFRRPPWPWERAAWTAR